MGFDLETWKADVTARLQDWRSRMKQAGATSIYTFLSAASLWPVVEAARGGEWAALAALGGVVANVGGNLLVNRIQGWKDEADATRQLASDMAADPSLRRELDAVLEKLDVLTEAQRSLPEEDRQWFVETLRAELVAYGNLVRFENRLRGSGATAQGPGSMAAGERGVAVHGPVKDSMIYTGDISQIVYAGGTDVRWSDPPPYVEIISPGSYFGRLDSGKGRFAVLLRVKFRNESEQPALVQHFRIQYLESWHEPMIHVGHVGLHVADGILAAGLRLEENISKAPRIPAMDVSERSAFFPLPNPPAPFPAPRELRLIAEVAFTRRGQRQIVFTLTDQGKLDADPT